MITVKDVLVHLDAAASCADVWLSVELARAHGAHLTGLCDIGEPLISAMVLGFAPQEALTDQRRLMDQRVEAAVAGFFEAAARESDCLKSPIAHMAGLDVATTTALHAHYADVAMIGRTNPENGDAGPACPNGSFWPLGGRPRSCPA